MHIVSCWPDNLAARINQCEEPDAREVHYGFLIAELITMEDMGVSKDSEAWRDVPDGVFDGVAKFPATVSVPSASRDYWDAGLH